MVTTTEESSNTLSRQLSDRLRKRIQDSSMKEGDLFMTEQELAEEYQVSRGVVREAVGRLKALGILEGRKRKGLVISKPDPFGLLSETLPSLINSHEDIKELSMLRYAVEIGSIELAVRNASDAQIEELGTIVSEMGEVCRATEITERLIELDLAFHTLLLEMTGSTLISGMRRLLVAFFRRPWNFKGDRESLTRTHWVHDELYRAIRDRDTERARNMIRLQFANGDSDIHENSDPL